MMHRSMHAIEGGRGRYGKDVDQERSRYFLLGFYASLEHSGTMRGALG